MSSDSNSSIKKIFINDKLTNSDQDKLTNSDQDKLTNSDQDKLTNSENIVTNKKIIITPNNDTKQIIKKEKEKKMRVETHTWGLNNDDLSFDTQLHLLKYIYHSNFTSNNSLNIYNALEQINSKHIGIITSHIKSKISSYKQQDILKNRLNEAEFVKFSDVLDLLNESGLKCHYCACETYLLYEIVRENKQWSLDRINNNIGHNKHNLLNACLECNLKRRRTNKDAFMFTKNLKIVRLDLLN